VNAVRSTLLNSTLRFSLLRIICLSALMASFTALPACVVAFKENHGLRRYALIAVLWPFFVFIHHFARFITQEPSFSASNLLTGIPFSAFGPRSSLPGILDVLLVVFEVTATGT